jgi:predicted  nucleic acid-binding Zn-ribbon protein
LRRDLTLERAAAGDKLLAPRGLPDPMQETIKALRALQELDHEIYRLRDELRRLPEERRARRAQLDQLIQRRDDVKKQGLDLRVRIKEIDDTTHIQRQRVRKVEHEAAGSRSDMALLAAFQHQVRTLKRDIGTAEEEGLLLLEQAQNVDVEVARLQAEVDTAEGVFAAFSKNVDAELATAKKKLADLERQRSARMSDSVAPESLSLYERLLSSRQGVALAELDSRICQACYMEVPVNLYVRVARGTQLVQCPSCDRIFYVRA